MANITTSSQTDNREGHAQRLSRFALINAFVDHSHIAAITGPEFMVWIALWRHAGQEGITFVGDERIAEIVGTSTRNVQRCIFGRKEKDRPRTGGLIAKGFVIRLSGGGRGVWRQLKMTLPQTIFEIMERVTIRDSVSASETLTIRDSVSTPETLTKSNGNTDQIDINTDQNEPKPRPTGVAITELTQDSEHTHAAQCVKTLIKFGFKEHRAKELGALASYDDAQIGRILQHVEEQDRQCKVRSGKLPYAEKLLRDGFIAPNEIVDPDAKWRSRETYVSGRA